MLFLWDKDLSTTLKSHSTKQKTKQNRSVRNSTHSILTLHDSPGWIFMFRFGTEAPNILTPVLWSWINHMSHTSVQVYGSSFPVQSSFLVVSHLLDLTSTSCSLSLKALVVDSTNLPGPRRLCPYSDGPVPRVTSPGLIVVSLFNPSVFANDLSTIYSPWRCPRYVCNE